MILSEHWQRERIKLCHSLLWGHARHVDDNQKHEGPSRHINTGYYKVLTDYDSQSDTFNGGDIPALQVQEVAVFELACKTGQLFIDKARLQAEINEARHS